MLSVFLFLLGFSLGVYFGIDAQSSLILELIGKKSNYDVVMFIATCVAALGTAVATTFAFYLYFSWKEQQNEIDLMATRKELLKTLIMIEKEATRLFISYRFNPKPKEARFHEKELSKLLAEFKTHMYLLHAFSSNNALDDKELLSPQCDYLDSSKELYVICSELYSSSTQGYLRSEEVQDDILRKVTVNMRLDFDGTSTIMGSLKTVLNSDNSSFSKELRGKLAKAAKDISNQNARSGI